MTIRQLKMVKQIMFYYNNRVSVEVAQELNQLTFGSLCYRKWVGYSFSRGFYVTKLGRTVYELVATWQPYRKDKEGEIGSRVKKLIGGRRWKGVEQRVRNKSRKRT